MDNLIDKDFWKQINTDRDANRSYLQNTMDLMVKMENMKRFQSKCGISQFDNAEHAMEIIQIW